MIRRRNFVPVDPQGQERLSEELWPFDLAANEGDICRYAAGCIPTHWHREPELFILLGGEVRIRAGGDTVTLRAGEGCLINGSTLHGFTACSDPCPYRSIVFDPGLVAGEPGSIFDTKYVRPLLCGAPWQIVDARETVFFAAFDRVFSACASEAPGYELAVRAALSELVFFFIRRDGAAAPVLPEGIGQARLKQMVLFIHENTDRTLTLAEIARAASVCPRECQRIFRRYLHYGPTEYARRRRILAAAELLATTEREITTIALDCGFDSPAYFSAQFRRVVGSTPSAYRRAARAANG